MPVTSYPFILEFQTPQTFGPIGQQFPSKLESDILVLRARHSMTSSWRILGMVESDGQSPDQQSCNLCSRSLVPRIYPMTLQGLTFVTALNTRECAFSGNRFLTPLLHPKCLSNPQNNVYRLLFFFCG